MDLLPFSIGIGLAVSLLFSELFGMVAGGMVVPGYIALYLNKPMDILLTFAAGLATYALVRALSGLMIVYGRRRTVLTILIGYLIGAGVRLLLTRYAAGGSGLDFSPIGFIIPGLIALWIDRQGLLETFSTIVTVSVVVRLLLILAAGGDLWSLSVGWPS